MAMRAVPVLVFLSLVMSASAAAMLARTQADLATASARLQTDSVTVDEMAADAESESEVSPISKVVKMLNDMKAELEKEMADDEEVYEQVSCWCEMNNKEKDKAIEEAQQKMEQLKSAINEYQGKIVELRETIQDTREKRDKDQKALDTAKAMRMKEIKEFHSEETELISAVQACKQALVVLSKHHPGGASLTQVKDVIRGLQGLRVNLLSETLNPAQRGILKAFMQEAMLGSPGFMEVPGFTSYAPQSGQVFGILKQMKETFEKNLSEAGKAELAAQESFAQLKAAKEAEIAASKKAIEDMDAELADTMSKMAQAEQDKQDTFDQLNLDQQFLFNLLKQCKETDKEYEERKKARQEEILAVNDVISFLHSDDAMDLFNKAMPGKPALLQMRMRVRRQSVRQRLVHLLQKAAAKHPELAFLATSAQLDAFTKVKEVIDKMVAELKTQMADEVKHNDFCIAELNKNTLDTDAKYHERTTLEAKIEEMTSRINALAAEMKELKERIAESQKQMKKASETREAENAEYQTALNDQVLTQAILQKALDRMKQVYDFLQTRSHSRATYRDELSLAQEEPAGAPQMQLSGNATDPGSAPARFKEYSKNQGGSKVVAMLEKVIKDAEATAAEIEFSERNAQREYENFMQDSNKEIAEMSQALTNKGDEKAKLEEEKVMSEESHADTMKDLELLSETATGLHNECDFIMKNFDVRQDARQQEIDALGEAKAILSGMQ